MISTIKIMLKGAAMGVAEVIPGVSGGTIAFITGIYERLLLAIRSINLDLFKDFKQGGISQVWNKIDGTFLLKLFGGMGIGIVVGTFTIVKLLDSHPVLIWSFFFGLILASVPYVARQVKQWGWWQIVLVIIGTIGVYWITVASPSQGSENLLIVFLAGVLAVSALMLPGLSGSFVLLLLGMYTIIVPTFKDFVKSPFEADFLLLVAFGLGMIVGLFSFARVLTYTFKKHPNSTLALLTGLLIGSLNKVWPWQSVIEIDTTKEGFKAVKFSESVLPSTFSELPNNYLFGNDAMIWQAVLCMIAACALVFGLSKLSVDQ